MTNDTTDDATEIEDEPDGPVGPAVDNPIVDMMADVFAMRLGGMAIEEVKGALRPHMTQDEINDLSRPALIKRLFAIRERQDPSDIPMDHHFDPSVNVRPGDRGAWPDWAN